MYFMLRCLEPLTENGEALMEIHNCFRVGNIRLWRGGRKHTSDVPTPIEIDFEPLRDYDGPPIELRDVCIPIMSARLADTLVEAGVDSVDFYEAVLKNTKTGQRYDYRAFNVVGNVAAADLERSEGTVHDGRPVADVSFKALAFEESKAMGMRMFRLAE